jgi:hypothetical protein
MANQRSNGAKKVLSLVPHLARSGGNRLKMGLVTYVVEDQAIERGFQAGVDAHRQYVRDHDNCVPALADENMFVAVLDAFYPGGMSENDASMWRAAFIAGWVSVFLGF